MEHFEYMDTAMTEYRDWCEYEADMAEDPYEDEDYEPQL